MRLFGYARYSSEAQRDGYSIEAQKNAIEDFCKQNNHILLHLYVDEAQSATNDNRESFQECIHDAVVQEVDGIVVHKLDRFARNKYDSAFYGRIIEDNGVKLISVLEPMIADNTPEVGMMRGFLETMNEYYSKNLARETLKGKKVAAAQCKHLGGDVPIGLMLDADNHYLSDPKVAPFILELFQRCDGGASVSELTSWLIGKGVKTQRGTYPTTDTVDRLLRNPLYIGRYSWDTRSKATRTPMVTDHAFPAIVDETLFWRVQKDCKIVK